MKIRLEKIDWFLVILVVGGLALLAIMSWLSPGFDYPKSWWWWQVATD